MLFIETLWQRPEIFITWVLVVAFSICIHELAHVYAAWSQGDDTAVRQGYLTLDPRRLMGRASLLTLALFGIAWGAVPVSPSRFRQPWSAAFVAFSGPGANLALAVLFAAADAGAERLGAPASFRLLFRCGLQGNALLAVLNLLPIPVFDGWEVFSLVIPAMRRVRAEQRHTWGWILVAVLFFTPASGMVHGLADALASTLQAAAATVL